MAEAGNPMRRLVLNDACEGTGVDPEACRAEQDGALTQGTHTAVRRLVNAFGDANDAVSAARLAHAGNCSTYLAAVRGSRSVQAMGDLALALTHPFLREALWAVQAGFLDAAEAKVEASRRTVWGGTVSAAPHPTAAGTLLTLPLCSWRAGRPRVCGVDLLPHRVRAPHPRGRPQHEAGEDDALPPAPDRRV